MDKFDNYPFRFSMSQTATYIQCAWPEYNQWLSEHIGPKNWDYADGQFLFKNESDLMLFKLKWGTSMSSKETEVVLYDIDLNDGDRESDIVCWLVEHQLQYEIEVIDITDFSTTHDTAFVYKFRSTKDALLFKLRWC